MTKKTCNSDDQSSLVIPLSNDAQYYLPKDLKNSTFLLRNLMENLPDNIYVKDEQSRMIIVNKAYCDWAGLPLSEIIGKTDHDLFSGEHADSAMQEEQQIMATGTPLIGVEEKETWLDGHTTWVSTTKMPLINNEGKIIGTFGISRDITEKKELEGQLIQAQKLESVGQLAAGIAHEINTPIQFVGDNLQFLQDSVSDLLELVDRYNELIELAKNGELNSTLTLNHEAAFKNAQIDYLKEEVPLAISQSKEGIERVSKIVGAMNEFSHPGSTEMSNANINKAIATTITVTGNEWKQAATVNTHFSPELPLVKCLIGEFNQVILNMIVNARDAILDTGKIGVISISTTYDKDWVIIHIQDTGAGMPPEVQQRIFDPFFTTKEVGKGTGQGLAIAHNLIVKKHKGELTVKSAPGNGTTFEIKLPRDSIGD